MRTIEFISEDYTDLNTASEAEQIAAVQQNATAIYWISNPSEAVQIAAVQTKTNPSHDIRPIIYHIPNPSEAVQLASVKNRVSSIQYIKNPSEAVQMAAVQQNIDAIQHIPNPSPELFADPDVKRSIIVAILKLMKNNRLSDVKQITDYLNQHHVDWPELAVINRSLNADKLGN